MTPSSVTATAAQVIPWYRTITREQWRVLAAAKFGWMLDAMDFMLYAMAHRPAPRVLRVRRRDRRAARHGDARDVGRRRPVVRLRRGPVRPHARADGDDRALLARVARRRDVAERAAAAALARAARHRHGRRVGVGRGARQRDVAAGASQQGDQHHAVGLGDRLHRGRAAGRADPEPARSSATRHGAGCSSPASLPALFTIWIRRNVREPPRRGRARAAGARRAPESVQGDLRAGS